MAIKATRHSLAINTAVKIGENTARASAPDDHASLSCTATNMSAVLAVVYVGGTSAVTPANGHPWDSAADGDLDLVIEPGEELWAVAGSAQELSVLIGGR